MSKEAKQLLQSAEQDGVKYVSVRFSDILGMQHHFTMPLDAIDEKAFTYGLGFDGSSIRGWKTIDESDMLVRLDATASFIDPFFQHKTLTVLCDVVNPDGTAYNRDPRHIMRKCTEYLRSTEIADQVFLGPEAEFFIFSDARFGADMSGAFYKIDSEDAAWRMGSDEQPNLAYKNRIKGGYFPVPPNDPYQDLRSEMLEVLRRVGIKTEKHHHEVASAGQAEINLQAAEGLGMADQMQTYKYVVKNVAKQAGFTATFMPKPVFDDNGSGMHTHQSLWKGGTNLFAGSDKDYGNISDMGRHYVGGLLKHAPAILAFTNATTNSYKRLVPGFEAPVNLVYSARNRSAAVRIPVAVTGDKARRIEFRTPDPSCNPYLAFAAMIMAGLDGVKNKIEPGEPCDFDLYEATPDQLAKVGSVPSNLGDVLKALDADHDFLCEGDVFDKDFIHSYIEYKREEVKEVENLYPHPQEFVMYYDC